VKKKKKKINLRQDLENHRFVQPGEPIKTEERVQYCKIHPGNKIEGKCQDCNSLICAKCLVYEHQNHQFMLIDQLTATLKNEFAPLSFSFSRGKPNGRKLLRQS